MISYSVLRVVFAVSAFFMVGLGLKNCEITNSFIFEIKSWFLSRESSGISSIALIFGGLSRETRPVLWKPTYIYCICSVLLIKRSWLRWPQSPGSSVRRRIRSVSSDVPISIVWTYSDTTRAIGTVQTIMWMEAGLNQISILLLRGTL